MPLPLFFIGAAVATSVIGGEKTIQAAMDNSNAKKINMIANDNIESARTQLERQRQETGLSLDQLGKIKLEVLDHDVLDFVTTFEKIKNIDFQSSIGLDELKDLHIDQNTFTELKELGNFALEVAGGGKSEYAPFSHRIISRGILDRKPERPLYYDHSGQGRRRPRKKERTDGSFKIR